MKTTNTVRKARTSLTLAQKRNLRAKLKDKFEKHCCNAEYVDWGKQVLTRDALKQIIREIF